MPRKRELRIIEKDYLGTLYAFRGPRSHRLVSIHVPTPEFQRDRERLALQKAAVKDDVRNWDGTLRHAMELQDRLLSSGR